MAPLTKDRNTKFHPTGEILPYPVATGAKLYQGGFSCLNLTGYAVAGANVSGYKFLGVNEAQADNTSGANGAKTASVRRKGVAIMAASGLAVTDVGKDLYLVDDQTVSTTPTNVRVGRLAYFLSATEAPVELDPPVTLEVFTLPAAANAVFALGDLVCSKADGYAQAGANTTGLKLEGTCQAAVDNTGGADGAVSVTVKRDKLTTLTGAGLVAADLGKPAWVNGAQAMSITPGFVRAGTIAKVVSATSAIIDLTEGYDRARTPGRLVVMSFQCATPSTSPGVTVASKFEFPVKVRLLRSYLECTTAPGGTDTLVATVTDGTNPKTVTITGAATAAEDEAVNQDYPANTDMSVNFTRTGASAAGASLVMVFELL